MSSPTPLQDFGKKAQQLDSRVFAQVVRALGSKLCTLAVSGAKDHFTQSAGPDGKPWRPLAHKRPSGGNKILRDKGLLAASLSASVTQEGLLLKASHPGANAHQFGAKVRPKKAKYLTIPITKEAARAGSPRKFPRKLFFMGGGTSAVMAEKKGRSAKIVVHYALSKGVTIPARPFVGYSKATLDKMLRLIVDQLGNRVAAGMSGST